MSFKIIRNNIVNVKADAIVDSCNPKPVIGGGEDSAIYEAAGREALLAARKKIGEITPGCSAYTDAFKLRAKHIIHTAGPVWKDGQQQEEETLRNCYRSCLELADKLSCKSIAFPLISSGSYGFPKDRALAIALEEIQTFLETKEMRVILVVFDEQSFALSQKLRRDIDSFLDNHQVHQLEKYEYRNRKTGNASLACGMPLLAQEDTTSKGLEELFSHAGKTFQEKLLELIDESGMDDVTVYKKANVDRKVFSRIRSNSDYHPSKKTAVAFAIALELDEEETNDLLARAGYALSPIDKADLIIQYFMKNHNYNMFEINAALFAYHLPLLG